MVNPLGSTAVPVANPASIAFERPIATPEPARQVTPAQEATSGNTSTAAGGQNANSAIPTPLETTLAHLNDNLKAWSTGMRFEIDPDSQRLVVSIIDNDTGEVLRTVPTDAVIRVAKMITQLQEKSIDTKA